MRKIISVFLLLLLGTTVVLRVSAAGNKDVPESKTKHTSPLACPSPGTYTIGPGGNYTSIGAALTDLYSCAGITGSFIFEFKSTYVSSVETFPISFNAVAGAGPGKTITFRPEAAAVGLSITSNNTTGTLLFNGGNYYIFDGRAGGTGSTRELTIQNTNVGNSYAARFVNDASNNTITWCNVKSANNNAAGGTIIIAGTSGTTGNDNISISNNVISDASTGAPTNCILSSGSTTSSSVYNSNISITGNTISNFYSATNNIAGINIVQGSSTWTINNNVFSHTFGTTKNITGIFSAISAVNANMTDFTITANSIGGSAALPSGGNIQLGGTGVLQLIRLSLGTSVVNSIQGNNVWNIIFNSTASSMQHSIYNLLDGSFSMGGSAVNTVGSNSTAGNLAISLNGSSANNFAIINCGAGATGMGTVTIQGNFVSNIDLAGTSSTTPFQVINVAGNSGTYTISGNTLGSSTNTISINNYLNNVFTGINMNLPAGTHNISGNSVNNVWLPNTGSNGQMFGIRVQGNAVYNITGNTVLGFRSSSNYIAGYSVTGISNTATAAGQLISGNKIYSLQTLSATGATDIVGIYFAGPSTAGNVVEKNFVHSFAAANTFSATSLIGIDAAAGNATYRNNMVRLGITNSGASVTAGYDIKGITEAAACVNDIYFNSIYIGGSGVGSGSNSYAFNSDVTAAVTRNYKNNIFFNERSNTAGSSPLHYAIRLAGVSGATSDYNVLLATGNGRMLGNAGGVDYSTFTGWKTAVAGDANSYSVNPQFAFPTGTFATVDLHIKASPTYSITEGNGLAIGSVNDDYDAQVRSGLTPADIGADAGNFRAVAKTDMAVINLLSPGAFACQNATQQVKVEVTNTTASAISFAAAPLTVTVAVSGAATATLTTTVASGSLAAGATLVVTMPSTLNMSAAGTYNFNITISTGGSTVDIDYTNNIYTTSVTPSPYSVGTLSTSVVDYCNFGLPVLTLTGTKGNVQWQQASSSGGPWTNVGTNSLTYSPSTITATTYFQALISCGAGSTATNIVSVVVTPPTIANTGALANGSAALTVCSGSSITLTQTGGTLKGGAQWQWYEGTALNNFVTPVGAPTTAANASTTITPTASATYYLRASGGASPCNGNVPAASTGNPSVTVAVNPTGTWLGNNNNWNDVANWCGGIPTATTDAIIPTGVSIYPVISTIQQVRNITIQNGAAVTLNAAGELTIKGTYSNAGTLANNGKIILNGTAAQSFPGAAATITAMNLLEVNNSAGVNIDAALTVTGRLTPVAGAITLNNNNITLHSDASATASVGIMGAAALFNYNGTGKFVIERYIPAKRAWRLLTAPVNAATAPSINAAWQEGVTKWPMGPATGASNPAPGYGTHISGGTNANGYDQNVNGSPSLKIFAGTSWTGLPVATSLFTKKITDERGYMLFVRGSRGVDLSFGTMTVPDNTTLRVSGQLRTANLSPITVTATGLNVVGNPFASAINFNTFATQNGFTLAQNKFYLWDPTLTGSNGNGAWVTLAYNGSTYDRTVTAFNDYPSSGGSQGIDNLGTIQSGAAFMMDFGATSKTVNFSETIKTNGSTSLVFRPVRRQQFRTNLYGVNTDGTTVLMDGVLSTYHTSYNSAVDELDVDKLMNGSENLGISNGGRTIAIDRRSPVGLSDTIFLTISQMRARSYELEFIPDSMDASNLSCYLEDTYLGTTIPVSLAERNIYKFKIVDNASAVRGRFRLIFRSWMRFVQTEAVANTGTAKLKWTVTSPAEPTTFEIQRSVDGTSFEKIGTTTDAKGVASYNFDDVLLPPGEYYYRIKAYNEYGVSAYSAVKKVKLLSDKNEMYVYPNPVTNNNISLRLGNSLPAGTYKVQLLSSAGNILFSQQIYHAGGAGSYLLQHKTVLPAGLYQLDVLNPDKSKKILKLVVNR